MRGKFLLSAIATFFVLISNVMANAQTISKSEHKGLTKVTHEVTINAPKALVWSILTDYDNLDWTETVTDAHYIGDARGGLGMTRHCDLTGGGFVVERITAWDEGNGFTYAIDDGSQPVKPGSVFIWSLDKQADGSTLMRVETHYALKFGVAGNVANGLFGKRRVAKTMRGFMNEFKAYAERAHDPSSNPKQANQETITYPDAIRITF